MADNVTVRGFRWVRSESGVGKPPILELPVADAYATKLCRGDAVKFAADGSMQRAAAADALIYGVVAGVKNFWDGTFRQRGSFVPASTTYGTDLTKQTLLQVIPVMGQIFEIDSNDSSTATTELAYQALVNENCDHVIESGSLNISYMALNISTHAITAKQWRIIGISKTLFNQDFTGNRVKLLVQCNQSEAVPYSKTESA